MEKLETLKYGYDNFKYKNDSAFNQIITNILDDKSLCKCAVTKDGMILGSIREIVDFIKIDMSNEDDEKMYKLMIKNFKDFKEYYDSNFTTEIGIWSITYQYLCEKYKYSTSYEILDDIENAYDYIIC